MEELRGLHDAGNGENFGFFSVLCSRETFYRDGTSRAPRRNGRSSGHPSGLAQRSYSLQQAAAVLPMLDSRTDTYVSQSLFTAPNRRVVNFWRTGVIFVDIDAYHTEFASFSPEQMCALLLEISRLILDERGD